MEVEFQNVHIMKNGGRAYTAIDAKVLNAGGSSGRGNWRYILDRKYNGEYRAKISIANHNAGSGEAYNWFFIDL